MGWKSDSIMRIVTDSKVGISWSVNRIGDRGLMLSVVVKAGFVLNPDAPMKLAAEPPESSGDQNIESEDGRKELAYPSDFVPFKPRSDVLLLGTAYAPAEKPVSYLKVSMRVGQLRKEAHIFGDRYWKRRFPMWSEMTPPVPFRTMPIQFARAFGGAKFKMNPAGFGFQHERLPNIELPNQLISGPSSHPTPASFGPVAADWEPRRSKVGSYKGNWQKERWPWFPDNFDSSYFNAAPEDQQVEGYLRGDEELEFQNLHPKHSVYRSRLPGLRARAFVQVELVDAQTEFREVKLNLDTAWINLDKEQVVLVWRGLTPIRSLKLKDVTHLAALVESLELPQPPLEEMRVWMSRRIQQDMGEAPATPEEAQAEAAAQVEREAFTKEMAALDQEKAELEKEFEAMEKQLEEQLKQEKDRLIAEGIEPDLLEQVPKPQSVAEIKAELANQVAQLAEIDPQAAGQLAAIENDLVELANLEQEFAALEAQDPPAPTRESVQTAIAQGKALKNTDLSGLDFSNLDLTGADFSGADLSGANLSGVRLVASNLKGARFGGADLTGADFTRAILEDANFSEANLQGACFINAELQGASFVGLQLAGLNFSGCKGRYADFSASNLEGANFAGAKLVQPDFSKANVKRADFTEAELVSADFCGVMGIGVNMTKADLTNLRAGDKADFTEGLFCGAKAPRSTWQAATLVRADFSRAILSGALFEDALVQEANFDRADLVKASFEDASAQRAKMTNANLLRACFNRAQSGGNQSFWIQFV